MKETRELEKIFEGCLGDRPAPCTAACPAHVDVRGFIALIKEGRHREALELFKKEHPFPSICGRVCHHPCEEACTRRDVDLAVAIEALHRFPADLDLRSEKPYVPEVKERKEEKIAMIGAGPASLSAAYFLAKEGYPVTVFEKLPYAGGMMAAGIPAYRLPRDILQAEIQVIRNMGVDIKTGVEVGKDISIEKLRQEGAKAIFIGIGARECRGLGIEGEDLEGVCPGVDFLFQVNQGNPVLLGDRVAVIGGGNVAMDAVRTALRTGSEHPSLIYRRSLKEMPVDEEEIEACREEGIQIHELTAPVRIIGEGGRVKALECIRMTLGEPDKSGRPRPIPVKGSEFVMELDGVIPAIGQESDWACLGPECACTLSEWGTMNVDPVTYQTEDPDLFAGGDAVTGPRTVVEAVEAGKQAAVSIDRYLRGIDLKEGREREWDVYRPDTLEVTPLPRTVMKKMSVDERKGGFQEVFLGFSEDEAMSEANRCLSCECMVCVGHCEFLKSYGLSPRELTEKIRTGDVSEMPEMPFSCNLCGLCHQFCPEELDVGRMCMEARETLFKEGAASLPGHRFVRTNQDFALSDAFTLALPDPDGEKCERAFFPGCSLPAYSPSLAMKTYEVLREKLPGTGIVLSCCGKQTLGIGDRPGFEEVMEKTLGLFKSLGTSEVIVACPECYHTLKRHAPGLTLTFLTDVLLKTGLPENTPACEGTFSIHDSCSVREETHILDSIRTLLRKMGCEIEEMAHSREKTRCCGSGGMVPFSNPKLAGRVIKARAGEADHDILTYCAGCRETLGAYKPALHFLDLILNPDWKEAKDQPPKAGKARRDNMAALKSLLMKDKYGLG